MKGRKPLGGRPLWAVTESDIEKIHRATVEVLETVGVLFESEEALKVLASGGAQVDGALVKFPEAMVEKAIGKCPQYVTLKARNPEYNVELGRGKVHYTNAFGATWVRDLYSGEYRDATLRDLENFVRLADYLPNVHYVLTQVLPQDVAPELQELYWAYALLSNTEKNVHFSIETADYVEPLIEMGMIASREAPAGPVFSTGTVPVTPLRYTKWAAERIVKAANHNVPFLIVSGAMAGGTTPATLAGALVVQNAEVLGGFILGQLMDPGWEMIYGSFTGPMDMRTGKFILGSPELSLMNAATQLLCEWYYKIPFGYGTGGIADSPYSDAQAQMEKSLTTLFGTLAGVDVIHDGCSGLLASGMITAYEQLVMDNEMCNIIDRMMDGIEVNEETLAVDLIRQIGPGGEYISADHTLRHFKSEYYLGRLQNRALPFGDNAEEKKDFAEAARERAREILETHQPKKLSDDTLAEMRGIIKRYEK